MRSNVLEPSRLFNFEAGGNVYTRLETLSHPKTGLVGAALGNLREGFFGEHATS